MKEPLEIGHVSLWRLISQSRVSLTDATMDTVVDAEPASAIRSARSANSSNERALSSDGKATEVPTVPDFAGLSRNTGAIPEFWKGQLMSRTIRGTITFSCYQLFACINNNKVGENTHTGYTTHKLFLRR